MSDYLGKSAFWAIKAPPAMQAAVSPRISAMIQVLNQPFD